MMDSSQSSLDYKTETCSGALVQTNALPPGRNLATRVVTWSAMLLASPLPDIIYRQFASSTPIWIPIAQVTLLILGSLGVCLSRTSLCKMCGFLMALAAFRLGWSVLTPLFESSAGFQSYARNLRWDQLWFLLRLIPVIGALLMLLTLIGSKLTRRDLFLCVGNLGALSRPEPVPFFYRPVSWKKLGVAVLIIFGIALPLVLFATLPLDFTRGKFVWRMLPWGIATAAVNAANEEFQFRSVLLARLRQFTTDREAMLVTAALFGLGHYYGQPSGPLGVVIAGIAGWVWAKSMIETRGFLWSFSTHMVQDVVIFIFLAMTVSS